jgi:hypothetical protein
MSYVTVTKSSFCPSNSTDADCHLKVDVHVFNIDGTLQEIVRRTVFCDGGPRYIRYGKRTFNLRSKKGCEHAIVLPPKK